MSCTEPRQDLTPSTAWFLRGSAILLLMLAGCSAQRPRPAPLPPPPPVPAPVTQPAPPTEIQPVPPLAPPAPAAAGPKLPPPTFSRTHDELRRQAAHRLMAANPDRVYAGASPPILLAIPVLEVELNRDGSIKKIDVIRRPGQAPETVQMAIEAMHRAAPFGEVGHLSRPWKFSETFLFNDDRRFKPRTLDF